MSHPWFLLRDFKTVINFNQRENGAPITTHKLTDECLFLDNFQVSALKSYITL